MQCAVVATTVKMAPMGVAKPSSVFMVNFGEQTYNEKYSYVIFVIFYLNDNKLYPISPFYSKHMMRCM